MSWLERAHRSEFLRQLFPDGILPPMDVLVHELRIARDGMPLRVRFDLPSYTKNAPSKWASGEYNTVQVTLEAGEVVRMASSISSALDVLSLDIEIDSERVFQLELRGEGVSIECVGKNLTVANVSGYHHAI